MRTGFGFMRALKDAGAAIYMDGRGRGMVNISIGRPWRSLKCEAVYPHELMDRVQAERVIGA